MPHITRRQVDELIADIDKENTLAYFHITQSCAIVACLLCGLKHGADQHKNGK